MLLRFGVENHRSIRGYQDFSLVATSLKDSEDGLLFASPPKDGETSKALRVVPAAALYGANAAGKSTVLSAIAFFVRSIRFSHSRGEASGGTPHDPFLLDEDSRTRPSRYDADIVLGGVRYHYGFALDGKRFTDEWLYSYPLDAKRAIRTVLFYRDDSSTDGFHFGKSLKGENKQIAKLVRPNSLFLSAAAQNAHPILSELHEFFSSRITTRLERETPPFALAKQLLEYFGDNEARRAEAIKFLTAADVGVTNVDFSPVPATEELQGFRADFEQLVKKHLKAVPPPGIFDSQMRVNLLHRGAGGRSYPIDLDDESAGTVSLLQLIGPVFSTLKDGGVILLDELNSTLHPLVCRELIGLFCRPLTNPGGAQLIFSTHDTNLLTGGLLRRDQIWFAEKDGEGASHLYSLSEISVRASDNIERGYLSGRFGAVPFMGAPIALDVAVSEAAGSR